MLVVRKKNRKKIAKNLHNSKIITYLCTRKHLILHVTDVVYNLKKHWSCNDIFVWSELLLCS